MGTALSANYGNIQHIHNYDLWSVHTATHKTTNESVCLWLLDQIKLKERYPKRKERDLYLDIVISSLTQMRKYRHPKILKVLEIAEKRPDIGFASEPFQSIVSQQIKGMHPMDVAYISYQLAEVYSFLNEDARILHLCLNPTAILMDDQLCIKLTQFQFVSPITSNGDVQINSLYMTHKSFVDISIQPPELLNSQAAQQQSDIFIFGLFLYQAFTGNQLYQAKDAKTILAALPSQISRMAGIPADFLQLIQACLNLDPKSRPTFNNIISSPAFQSMQLKALRYIDVMLTKQPQDKFSFYKGLAKRIDDFSPSLQRVKMLPTLLQECKNEIKFAPILLGPIFQISSKFDSIDFMEIVWKNISFLATVVDPPEVSIALLRNMWVILEKIDRRQHKDYIYPIFFSALQSTEPRLHNECLEKINLIIDEMNEDSIRSLILPKLYELAINSPINDVVSSSLSCIAKCVPKIDNDTFTTDMVPKLFPIWKNHSNKPVGDSIYEIISHLNTTFDILMAKTVPLSADILGSKILTGETRKNFCNYIIKITTAFRDAADDGVKNFNQQVKRTAGDSDNPFSAANPIVPSSNLTIVEPSNPFQAAENPFGSQTQAPSFAPPPQPKPMPIAENPFDDSPAPKPIIPQQPKKESPHFDNPFGTQTIQTPTEKPAEQQFDNPFDIPSDKPVIPQYETSTPASKPFVQPIKQPTVNIDFMAVAAAVESKPKPKQSPVSIDFMDHTTPKPAPKPQAPPPAQNNAQFDFMSMSVQPVKPTPPANPPPQSFDFGMSAPPKPVENKTFQNNNYNTSAPSSDSGFNFAVPQPDTGFNPFQAPQGGMKTNQFASNSSPSLVSQQSNPLNQGFDFGSDLFGNSPQPTQATYNSPNNFGMNAQPSNQHQNFQQTKSGRMQRTVNQQSGAAKKFGNLPANQNQHNSGNDLLDLF